MGSKVWGTRQVQATGNRQQAAGTNVTDDVPPVFATLVWDWNRRFPGKYAAALGMCGSGRKVSISCFLSFAVSPTLVALATSRGQEL